MLFVAGKTRTTPMLSAPGLPTVTSVTGFVFSVTRRSAARRGCFLGSESTYAMSGKWESVASVIFSDDAVVAADAPTATAAAASDAATTTKVDRRNMVSA